MRKIFAQNILKDMLLFLIIPPLLVVVTATINTKMILFTITINFAALLYRGKEVSLSRIIGSFYKLPKSDPYAVN